MQWSAETYYRLLGQYEALHHKLIIICICYEYSLFRGCLKSEPAQRAAVPARRRLEPARTARRRVIRRTRMTLIARQTAFSEVGRLDLGLGRLEDGVLCECCPDRECRGEGFEFRVFGRNHHALAFGELAGELTVPGRQVVDQARRFP